MVCNFTPVPRHDYRIGVPRDRPLARNHSTRIPRIYGGGNSGNAGAVETQNGPPYHGHGRSISLMLPPLGGLLLAIPD